ncbi:Cyclohexanone monooxygenase [Patulibacter medicamentivorans]|uniref:Cyclohexanone monooxygenase n=1 Tax=Patulibacter medicamentivorans TaxID=1097667 RepID=H0EBA6_9ACTN|nr:NAD(P)/FAD-dependent oxidoreductase [Patulibacter medicamentivorans]EHN09070.1 Cyclohexanone monooxygenase [Patulibacter medicamentivorans]
MTSTTTRPPAAAYRDPIPSEVRVAVIGSGFSGLGIAIGLLEDGERDFVVLERADDIGGTWRDNTYPGCACDVPSHMYSYSFAPNPNWSRSFASQPEIWAYQQDVVARFGIAPYVRTGAGVTAADWDEDEQRWRIETERGTLRARFLISGTGPLCEPRYPELPGLERFEGAAFHSARWDHDHDLTGERVAVIGTGASAIQFVPRIQPQVQRLTLFQRTPPWIMPRPDRPIGSRERFLLRTVPGLRKLKRLGIYAALESRLLMFNHVPQLRPLARKLALRHIEAQVQDPVLRAKVTPDYDLGCKRVLLSNDYLPALAAPNADVITSGIREVRAHSIVDADGVEHQVDTIIYGTGFRVTDQPIAEIVRGRGGERLADRWVDGVEAYRGTTISGFPNLFMMVGPNTGLGHNSIIYMIESQMAYVRDALRQARDGAIGALAPKAAVQRAENEELQQRLEGTVWNDGGCQSWYLDARGRNSTLWPDFTFLYRRRTARFALTDYDVEPLRTAPPVDAPAAVPATEPVAV